MQQAMLHMGAAELAAVHLIRCDRNALVLRRGIGYNRHCQTNLVLGFFGEGQQQTLPTIHTNRPARSLRAGLFSFWRGAKPVSAKTAGKETARVAHRGPPAAKGKKDRVLAGKGQPANERGVE